MPDPLPETLAAVEVLRRAGGDIESTIRGDSMVPTLPAGARVRIDCGLATSVPDGEVAAFLAGDVVVGHRIVGRCRDRKRREALLLRGDARLVCDPPVEPRLVVGQIVAWCQDGTWRSVAPAPQRSPAGRAVAGLVLAGVRLAAWVDVRIASRLHEALLAGGLRALTTIRSRSVQHD